jgi:hypothetical protein
VGAGGGLPRAGLGERRGGGGGGAGSRARPPWMQAWLDEQGGAPASVSSCAMMSRSGGGRSSVVSAGGGDRVGGEAERRRAHLARGASAPCACRGGGRAARTGGAGCCTARGRCPGQGGEDLPPGRRSAHHLPRAQRTDMQRTQRLRDTCRPGSRPPPPPLPRQHTHAPPPHTTRAPAASAAPPPYAPSPPDSPAARPAPAPWSRQRCSPARGTPEQLAHGAGAPCLRAGPRCIMAPPPQRPGVLSLPGALGAVRPVPPAARCTKIVALLPVPQGGGGGAALQRAPPDGDALGWVHQPRRRLVHRADAEVGALDLPHTLDSLEHTWNIMPCELMRSMMIW